MNLLPFSRGIHVSNRGRSYGCHYVSRATGEEKNRNKTADEVWTITNYYTKKCVRQTDSLGNIISSPETISESPLWRGTHNVNKLLLAANALSQEYGTTKEELLKRFEELESILPGETDVLIRLKPADALRLAARGADNVTDMLLKLRALLPDYIDVTNIVHSWPEILLMEIEDIESGLKALYTAFCTEFNPKLENANLNSNALGPDEISKSMISGILSSCPQLLEVQTLQSVLQGSESLMNRHQLAKYLQQDPDNWIQFASLRSQARGHRETEYAASDDIIHRSSS